MAALDHSTPNDPIENAWVQVADLKPRLASSVSISRHSYRGENWFVLADRVSGSHFRCTPAVHQFLLKLDGHTRLADAYDQCLAEHADQHIDRLDVLSLLTELQSSQLLGGGAPPASDELNERRQQLSRRRWMRRLASPLAVQIPLLDPDRFLARAAPLARPILSRRFFYLWCLIVAATAFAAVGHLPALNTHWESRFLDPGNLLLLWLLYPVVKGLHELGHGLATRAWGGEVHEMGILLLVFTPVPYVDASASTAFQSRNRRMVVAAAGIIVELLLAGLALWLWIVSEPGLVRDACFNVLIIGGLSTVLFNGNPLLRFDGYYVLTDLIEIPNLRARANEYLGYLLKRYLLKLETTGGITTDRKARAWLFSYAILAGVYRLFISFTIALFIAGKYFIIGASLALWLAISQVFLPLYRILTRALRDARRQSRLGRLGFVSSGGLALAVLLLFVIPMGDSTRAEGIVNIPENSQLRPQAAGFIVEILKQSGQEVRAGDALIRLQNPELEASAAELSARRDEIALLHGRALSGEPADLGALRAEMTRLQDEINDIEDQLNNLLVLSPRNGIFSVPEANDMPGRFVTKGEFIGYVIDLSDISVRVVVSQRNVDQVRRRTRAIEVRLASHPNTTVVARGINEVPQATTTLPSALLGSRSGGDIAVDARDSEGLRSMVNVFQFDVLLSADSSGSRLGQRAYVRFIHLREPLGISWYRRLRQIFLSELAI